jgi:hypothetical protein
MTLDIRKSTQATQDALDASNLQIGAGATIEVYSTANPTSCDSPQTSTSLGSFLLVTPAFGDAFQNAERAESDANQTIGTASPTGDGLVIAWRIYNNEGTPFCVYQGEVGLNGTQNSLTFDDTQFQPGGTATVSTFKLFLDE